MRRLTPPEFITLEFLSPEGEPDDPSRVSISREQDERGGVLYRYEAGELDLPHGLDTFVKVEGTIIPMGTTHSAKNGSPTREGGTDVMIAGLVYEADASLAGTAGSFSVRVRASRKSRGA